MIKAIITDVDGVMVGARGGTNFPLPGPKLMKALRTAGEQIPVVLCTAKLGHAVRGIAEQAGLDNPHITDGGALIVDWSRRQVVEQHVLDSAAAAEFVAECLGQGIYMEAYALDGYYVARAQSGEFTRRRVELLQMEPVTVPDLAGLVRNHPVIKVMALAEKSQVQKLERIVANTSAELDHIWGGDCW